MKRLLFLLICFPLWLSAQEAIKGSYDSLSLKSGRRYSVRETVTVIHKLIIEPGVIVDFIGNGKIVIEGAVRSVGTANKIIQFNGIKSNTESTGIIIRSDNDSEIDFRYTSFDSLSMPISFESGWYRSRVLIENCQFKYTNGSIAIIQMLNPKTNSDKQVIAFNLVNNLFFKNKGSLYIEDFQLDYLKLIISKNVFIDNLLAGFGQYTFSGNFLYGRNDYKSGKHIADIRDNSFVRNFLKDIDADTIIKVAHFGVYGSAPALNVPYNYWGSPVEADVHSFVYDYVTNFNNPRLTFTGLLKKPSDSTFGHIYQININGKIFADDNLGRSNKVKLITLYANRRFGNMPAKVLYHYLKDSTEQKDTILYVNRRIESTGSMELSITDSGFISMNPGYFIISNLFDEFGEPIPEVIIGQRLFLTELYKRRRKIGLLEVVDNDIQIAQEEKEFQENRLSVGFIGGTSIFYGSVSNRSLFDNDKNALFGFGVRYRLNRVISLAAAIQKTTFSGDDNNSKDQIKQARGMSFVTPATFLSLKSMFEFGQKSWFYKRTSLLPAFGFGLSYMSFNPQGEYLGKLYDLQPLGTGGQLLAGSTEGVYRTSTLGAFISFELMHKFAKNWTFAVVVDYHVSFSDYLDDVGPNVYPDLQLMEAQISPIAAYFSNPTNRTVGNNELRSGVTTSNDAFFTFGFKLSRSLKFRKK